MSRTQTNFEKFDLQFQNTTGRKKPWAQFPGGNNAFANDTQGKTEVIREQEWQYRFSILPTKENLEKAAAALKNVALLQEENFPSVVKLRTVSGARTDGGLQYWDTAEPLPAGDAPADRQQAGKELCIYVENFDAKYHKELILQIWKAFEGAGVELGYRPIPQDEKSLNAEPGISCPVMYSAGKYDRSKPDHHGILHAEHYNPQNFEDPFKELRITKSDLKKYGIHYYDFVQRTKKQIKYQDEKNKTHITQLKSEWDAVNTASKVSERNAEPTISTVINDFIDDKRNDIGDFENRFPLNNTSTPAPFARKQNIEDIKKRKDVESKKTLFGDLNAAENGLVRDILNSRFFQLTGATNDEVIRAVTYQPQKMMELYRRSVHITHDIQATDDCKNRLINATPKTYSEIWDKTGGNDFAKAKSLLQDYTKDDSRLSRFFHGHVNRHHCNEVNDLLKSCTDISSLMSELSKIEIDNPTGSLAKRIAFIEAKTGVYCSKSSTPEVLPSIRQ